MENIRDKFVLVVHNTNKLFGGAEAVIKVFPKGPASIIEILYGIDPKLDEYLTSNRQEAEQIVAASLGLM